MRDCLVPRQVQESHFRRSAAGRLVPERFFLRTCCALDLAPEKAWRTLEESHWSSCASVGNCSGERDTGAGLWSSYAHEHCEPAPEMPSKASKPPCPPFPTGGKWHSDHCRERNMGLPPSFPRPPLTENVRERGETGLAALRRSPRPCASVRSYPGAAAPQRDAPPQPQPQPDGPEARTGPGRTRAATRRAERAGAGPDGAQSQPRRPTRTYRQGPPAPPPPGRQQEAQPALSPWEPGTPRRAGRSAAAPTMTRGGRQQSPRGARAYRTAPCWRGFFFMTWLLFHLLLLFGVVFVLWNSAERIKLTGFVLPPQCPRARSLGRSRARVHWLSPRCCWGNPRVTHPRALGTESAA